MQPNELLIGLWNNQQKSVVVDLLLMETCFFGAIVPETDHNRGEIVIQTL